MANLNLGEVFRGTEWEVKEEGSCTAWGKAVIPISGDAFLVARSRKRFPCTFGGSLRSTAIVKWWVAHAKTMHNATLVPSLCNLQAGELAWRSGTGPIIFWRQVQKVLDAAETNTRKMSQKRKRKEASEYSEYSEASTTCPCDADERPDAYDPVTKKGRFHYTKQLGKGAHGVVLEAVDMLATYGSPLVVAVKIPRAFNSKENTREKLCREHDWSRLFLHRTDDERGRLFLKYLEEHTGPEHSIPYVVMELAKGDLAWRVLFGKGHAVFSLADKRKIIHQMACALTYLTKFELLHRDLRFHNMFLSRTLELTIGDLGTMGRQHEPFRLAPHNEESWKKLDWIPWEARHLRGKASLPEPQSQHHTFDVFSLGVMHLYMCVGQAETRRVLQCIGLGCPVLDGEISKELVLESSIALRMLSKDPNERPTPGEIVHALEAAEH